MIWARVRAWEGVSLMPLIISPFTGTFVETSFRLSPLRQEAYQYFVVSLLNKEAMILQDKLQDIYSLFSPFWQH